MEEETTLLVKSFITPQDTSSIFITCHENVIIASFLLGIDAAARASLLSSHRPTRDVFYFKH